MEWDYIFLNVYPNPVKNELVIDIDPSILKDLQIIITDIHSRTLFIEKLNPERQQHKIDLSKLSDGIYFYSIKRLCLMVNFL